MSEEKKISPEVVRYVKNLAQGDIATVFQEQNPFKDPENGAQLSLSAETLDAIALGDFDHLLEESGKNSSSSEGSQAPKTGTDKGNKEKAEEKTEEKKDDKKEKKKKKGTNDEKKGKEKSSTEQLKKRGTIALAIIIPIMVLAIIFQEQILNTIAEVARSFAMVCGVLGLGFMVPFFMGPEWKKGLRILTFFCAAAGFHLITLTGVFIYGVLALAVAILFFTLAF